MAAKSMRIAFHTLCAFLFLVSILKVVNGDDTPVAGIQPQNVDSLAVILENKKAELQAREVALVEQERKLTEREADLDKKLKELTAVREGINASMAQNRHGNEERITRMVTVFETMQPKAVSQVFETLDDWLAVDVLKRMDTKKAAKIMNLMERNRSAKLSELLTGYYHERNPASAAQKDSARSNASQSALPSESKAAAASADPAVKEAKKP